MHGRTALAALLASAALGGCGQEAVVEPARIEITSGGSPPAAEPPPARRGKVRQGTLRMQPTVAAPPVGPATGGAPVPVPAPRRTSARRFRETYLRALRAHCATRPAGDPRCADGGVDERVAFAAFEDAR